MSQMTVPGTISVSEVARDVALHVGTVLRWVHQWSVHDKRIDPGGHGQPASMPYAYLYVARAWAQEQDAMVRNLMRLILSDEPNNFLVVVGTVGYSCYDVSQVEGTIVKRVKEGRFPLRVYFLGEQQPQ